MHIKNKILLRGICMVLCLLISLCACGKNVTDDVPEYNENKTQILTDGTVAENEKFTLSWDSERYALLLTSKRTGEIWSSIPYEFYKKNETSGPASVTLSSPLSITYIDTKMQTVKSIKASVEAYKNGRINAEKTEDGILVTYYFDKLRFSVPVEYKLVDRGLEARIRINEIVETDYPIYQISLLPNFVSAVNDTDSYLFVPSGSGALISTEASSPAKSYSESVYGEDPVGVSYADTTFTEKISLPVFGAKNGSQAMLAEITEGAETAYIEATAGDVETGYSSVYATFTLRGYDLTKIADHTGLYKYIKKFSQNRVDLEYAAVCYYPIEDYTADYNGMAQYYKSLLKEDGFNKEADSATALAVDFWGGVTVKKLFVGLPYYDYQSVTTFKEAENILKELNSATGMKSVVNLRGFGNGGLNPDKVAGGFKINSDNGGIEGYASLKAFCEKNGNRLFFDFDLIKYSKSGGGYKISSDTAKTANLVRDSKVFYHVSTNGKDKHKKTYYLISREKLSGIGEKLLKAVDSSKLDGISLATLSSLSYSDFSENSTYCKNGMAQDAQKIIKQLSDSGSEVMSVDANLYAALCSDYITNTPVSSSKYDCIETDIPFYQMVFKGSVPIYSDSINVSENPDITFLKAIESGMGLQFSFCSEYNNKLLTTYYTSIAASCYDDIKEKAIDYCNRSSDFLNSVKSSGIKEHSQSGNLSHTVFENGAEVYVNFGKTPVETPLGTVDGLSFIFGKEG